MRLRQFGRILHIGRILAKYRFDELAKGSGLARPVRWIKWLTVSVNRVDEKMGRGERIRLALQELGPIFVKFGQVLSTRRDVIPPDVADELALLQDQVSSFPGEIAQQQIEVWGSLLASYLRHLILNRWLLLLLRRCMLRRCQVESRWWLRCCGPRSGSKLNAMWS